MTARPCTITLSPPLCPESPSPTPPLHSSLHAASYRVCSRAIQYFPAPGPAPRLVAHAGQLALQYWQEPVASRLYLAKTGLQADHLEQGRAPLCDGSTLHAQHHAGVCRGALHSGRPMRTPAIIEISRWLSWPRDTRPTPARPATVRFAVDADSRRRRQRRSCLAMSACSPDSGREPVREPVT